jgi:hypothetical protein
VPDDSGAEQPELALGSERVEAPPATPPAPQYVTETQMKEGLERVLERVGSLVQGALMRAPAQTQAAPERPVRPEINLADIEDDIRQGREGAAARLDALIADRVERGVEKAMGAVDALSSVGLSNMEQLAREAALRAQDPKQVKRFGKELDAFMQTVEPAARANVDSWKRGWDYIRGQHYDELVAEDRELNRRQATAREPGMREESRAQRLVREDGSRIPSFEEWAGEEGLGVLREKKHGARDGDEYAQQAGFKNWTEFYTQRVEPFDRMDIDEYQTPRQLREQGYDNYRDMIDAKTRTGKYAPGRPRERAH